MSEYPMTFKGKEMLEKELDKLIKIDREDVKIAIAEARAHGDLKENADYSAAKERQSHIEGRIQELQHKLSRAKPIDISKVKNSKIVFGATVTLLNTVKEISVTYQIVGEDEADLKDNKISYISPLGKAMIGKEVGDEVVVKAPGGEIIYEVEDIEYK
jgi:transcription elongation factor GreA